MKKFTLPAIVAALLFGGTLTSHAQLKVATVDMNKIFSSYTKTKDAESRLNEARADMNKELNERKDAYDKNVSAINKFNEDLSKSELSKEKKDEIVKKRDDMISETKNLAKEMEEFRVNRGKQLQEQAVRMRNGIVEEITKLVNEEVKSNSYDVVLDRSGQSFNGVPIVLYARDDADFSDKIIEKLNKNSKAAASSEKSPASKK